MIQVASFDKEGYILLVVEVVKFKPLDLLKMQYPEVNQDQGVAIAAAPECDPIVIADLFLYYQSCAAWLGVYHAGLKGICVESSQVKEVVRSEVIPCQLPCLECWRNEKITWLKPMVKRPYCRKHYDCSPHRRLSRHKSNT